jgi:hypothetical protein
MTLRRLRPGSRAKLPSGAEVAFEIHEAALHHFPGWVDSNSPAFWRRDQLVLFNSAQQPVRSSGPSLEALGDPVDVSCLPCDRSGGRWIEAVWPDPSTGIVYGWYHFEPGDLACLTAPIIGAAISRDGGMTWIDQGPVLENGYPIDCDYLNGFFVGGTATSTSSPTNSRATSTSCSPTTRARSASRVSASRAAPSPIGGRRGR